MIKGIHHISMKYVTAEDFHRVSEFYSETLRLPILRTWDNGMMLDTGSGPLGEEIEFFRER